MCTVWADTETDTDFLNYSEIAELIVELIADDKLLPLSLGVFGGWGIGKSSTLNLVDRLLAREEDKYLIVRFDAWLYQDFDDARAALMSVISSALIKASPKGMRERAGKLLKRVNKLRLLGLLAEGGAAAMGLPTFGAASRLIEAGGKAVEGKLDEDDRGEAEDAAEKLTDRAGKLLAPTSEKEPSEEIAAFRREFGEVLKGLDRKLVVFIDNLDRCLPANTIHTLEAIRLFLFLPNTAFVIAADEDMVRHAVTEHFRDPGDRHVTDYLDKLIQMPVFVPRPGVLEVRSYLTLLIASRAVEDDAAVGALREFLIEELRHSWRDGGGYTVDKILEILGGGSDDLRKQIELGLRMAPMLAQSSRVNGNPRIVKRMMNVVRMRTSVAARRGMDLDEGVIAKLALFERCTDGPAIETLQHAIQASPNGRPDLLAKTEGTNSITELERVCPDSWKRHVEVIHDWLKLEPRLSGIDLRPAVYLARETVPMRLGGSELSTRTLDAIDQLIRVATVSSVAAREAAEGIDPAEVVRAMEEIIAEMRRTADWSKARSDVRGAVILARTSADAAERLNRYLRSLTDPPRWLGALLKNETWAELD
jgi:predicted KAP-like P-loop ATPase